MSSRDDPVRPARPKLSQTIAEQMRRAIAAGAMPAGSFLPPEPRLCEQFGVSRPTIREAVRILEAEGLVTTSWGGARGSRINAPSSARAAEYAGLVLEARGATIAEIFDHLLLVEPAAARVVAEKGTRPDLSPLYAIADEMAQASEEPRRMAELQLRFSETLLELTGNRATALAGQLLTHLLQSQLSTVPLSSDELPERNRQMMYTNPPLMRRVVDAMAEGNGRDAEALLHAVLRNIYSNHVNRLRQFSSGAPE